ncbi:MAG: HK97 family phage prohead protease [Pseudomonadota bacterium]
MIEAETKRAAVALENLQSDGRFSGYASLFNKVDLGKDRVAPGAFSKCLAKGAGKSVRMLFQHDPSEPIGTWEIVREDAKGLYVEGRISPSSVKGAEVLGLMRDGAIDGLSIGFRTLRSTHDRKSGVRTIREADLWEISIVTFPMLPQARIDTVKAGGLPTVRTFEHWLTRDAGLTRRQARVVIAKGYANLTGAATSNGAGCAETQSGLAQRIRRATQALQT